MKMISVITTLMTVGGAFILSLGTSSCGQAPGSRVGRDTGRLAATSQLAVASDNTTRSRADQDFLYDLDHPTKIYTLPEALTEVSGIRFHQADRQHIYAEQDEKGRLYWLRPGDQSARYYDFGKAGDFEDLAFINKQAVFLKSNGQLYCFDFTPAANKDAAPLTGPLEQVKDLVPKGEYEGLFADTAKNQLYMLCKDCEYEDHKKVVSVYRLDYEANHWVTGAVHKIDVSQISQLQADKGKKKKKHKKINFKPSAICQDPVTHHWLVLSSINKMLVVLGTDWQVRAVYPLKRKLYEQPEGICFDRAHNLYISNEGQHPGEATLLKFAPGH